MELFTTEYGPGAHTRAAHTRKDCTLENPSIEKIESLLSMLSELSNGKSVRLSGRPLPALCQASNSFGVTVKLLQDISAAIHESHHVAPQSTESLMAIARYLVGHARENLEAMELALYKSASDDDGEEDELQPAAEGYQRAAFDRFSHE